MRLLAFFCFPPGICPSAKGRPRPKGPRNPLTRISQFLTRGGPVGQNVKWKKVADNHLGSRGKFSFSVSGALAPGNCVFMFSARARNFSTCPRPKTGQHTTKSPFPTGGGPTEKKLFPRKLRKAIPDSVGIPPPPTLRPLLLCRPERALRG